MKTLLSSIYNLVWLAIMVFLKRSPRVSLGWNQRTLQEAEKGPYDIWIQAASGGESMLTNMVLDELGNTLGDTPALRILATSGTSQGIESLKKGEQQRKNADSPGRCTVTVAYFPLDAPYLMRKAFRLFAPRLAIIVETELWPGFLMEAKKNRVPVLLINGRMSDKSHRSYAHFSRFFNAFGPDKVLAISELDADRFIRVVGKERVEVINNIKFDRITSPAPVPPRQFLHKLLGGDGPFVVLGSIRKEEEEKIAATVVDLLNKRPNLTVGLFPKHIERAEQWLNLLEKKGIRAVKRSRLSAGKVDSGVIIWDIFGELAGAYALADAAFVGGSLSKWGGHNFLEPLVFGLRPIIGPHWQNFAWVGREIVDCGLVTEIADETELACALTRSIDGVEQRDGVVHRVQHYLKPKKGGTRQVCLEIATQLHSSDTKVEDN